MGVGAVNALLGYWIALINLAIAVYSLFIAHSVSPAVWVSILDIINVQNTYLQWAVLIISSIMGISEKGIQLLNLGDLSS